MEDTCLIQVSHDLINKCNGLVIDIGGSVIKVIYAELNNDQPKVSLASFQRVEITKALDFIKDASVIRRDKDDRPQIYVTGGGGHQYKDMIEEKLQIRLCIIAEGDCYASGIRYLLEKTPRGMVVLPTTTDLIETSLRHCRGILKHFQNANESVKPGAMSMGEFPDDPEFDIDEHVNGVEKYLTNMGDESKPFSEEADVYPCMLMNCGSGFCFNKIYKDRCSYLEGSPCGGKAFLGMGQAFLGARNYDELMAWAEQGNSNNVDNTVGDMRRIRTLKSPEEGVKEENIYTNIQNLDPELASHCFGKAAERPNGSFKKEDLAAALLRFYCADLAQLIEIGLRNSDVTHVFLFGSFVAHRLTQKMLIYELTERITVKAVLGGGTKPLKFHFLKNGGYIGAIGCLLEGAKRGQEQL